MDRNREPSPIAPRSIFQYCFLFKENNGYGRIEIYFFEMVNRSDEEVLWLTITSAYLMS